MVAGGGDKRETLKACDTVFSGDDSVPGLPSLPFRGSTYKVVEAGAGKEEASDEDARDSLPEGSLKVVLQF